jgi:tetratricopeptide (TPR) repeat protein
METKSKTESPSRTFEWVGPLSGIPLAEVMRRIALEERSGDLQVIFGQTVKTIKTVYFDRGFVVLAASNLQSDRLGESLIERGRISRHELALATMLMKTSQQKIGQALVQAGVLAEEEMGRHVALQVNRIVLSLFKVQDGIYSFDERPTSIPMKLMVSLSIYRILLEGIRRMTKGNLILAGLPPLDTPVCVSEQPPFTIEFDRLKPVEQSVLQAAGRGASIESIIDKVEFDRGRVLRACYGLMSAGLLEEGSSGKEPRKPLKVQEETGVFLLSDLEKKFAKIQATNARQEILMEFDQLGQMAEADLLKIDDGADMGAIQKAYEDRRKEWSIKRHLVEQEQSLVVKIDQIQARLDRAYQQMLSDKSAPSPPLSNQAAAEWSSPHLHFAESDPFHEAAAEAVAQQVEEVEEVAAADETEEVARVEDAQQQEETSAEATGDPAELEIEIEVETGEYESPSLPPLIEDEPEEASFISTEVEPQLGALIDLEVEEAAAPPETRPNVAEQTGSVEPAESVQSESAEAEKPTVAPLTGMQRVQRVQQLFRDVKLHFQVSDWDGAISLLFELVELAPDNPAYHGMLAKAMLRHPVMRKNAERHFIEALRLAPQDADLHFWLGLYYKTFGLKSRAETEFRTTLRIDPRHEGARKYMGGERRKDPFSNLLGKIFG